MPTLDWIGKDKVINHHNDVPYKVLERKYSYDEDGEHKDDIHSENMIIHDELKVWYQQSGLPIKKFFNTSGLVYKEMQLKDKLTSMSEEEQLMLLATHGMLVKRPMMITHDIVLVGFKEADWEGALL